MAHRIFVYGSLKRGFRHHEELRGARYEGVAETASGYALYVVGDYPAMVRQGTGRVVGEVYTVDEDHLRRLDAFEDCPELYERQSIILEGGRSAEAYLMAPGAVAGCECVASGSWLE